MGAKEQENDHDNVPCLPNHFHSANNVHSNGILMLISSGTPVGKCNHPANLG